MESLAAFGIIPIDYASLRYPSLKALEDKVAIWKKSTIIDLNVWIVYCFACCFKERSIYKS